VVWTFKLFNFTFHLEMVNDFIHKLLVHISVINGKGDSWHSKPSRSSNSMKIRLRITTAFFRAQYPLGRNIVIDNELCFWHIDTSGKDVGGNEDVNLLFSEFFHGFIAFLIAHLGCHDERHVTCLSELLMNLMSKILGVYENEGLSHCAGVKHVHDKVELTFSLRSQDKLLDMF